MSPLGGLEDMADFANVDSMQQLVVSGPGGPASLTGQPRLLRLLSSECMVGHGDPEVIYLK